MKTPHELADERLKIAYEYGRLKIVNFKFRKRRKNYFECICNCGKKTITDIFSLKSGHTKSCGCLWKEKCINKGIHKMTNTPFYNMWLSMKRRCDNPNQNNYERYGARGIKICKRWKNFENFKDDMYKNYLKHKKQFPQNRNTQIDRINNNKNYEPNNCKWATAKEQAKNRRKRRWAKRPIQNTTSTC